MKFTKNAVPDTRPGTMSAPTTICRIHLRPEHASHIRKSACRNYRLKRSHMGKHHLGHNQLNTTTKIVFSHCSYYVSVRAQLFALTALKYVASAYTDNVEIRCEWQHLWAHLVSCNNSLAFRCARRVKRNLLIGLTHQDSHIPINVRGWVM